MKSSVLSFQHLGFSCTLIRSSRKTVSLSLEADGTVLIRGPLCLSEEMARRAVEDNQPWLLQRKQTIRSAQERPLLQGGRIWMLGRTFALYRGSQPSFGENWLCLPRRIEDERAAVSVCCRGLALEEINRRIRHYAPLLGVTPASVSVGRSNSSWGSCRRDGRLLFSWKAVFLYPEDLDYLVVHELCHLRYFDHSKAFWWMVSTQIPNYKERIRHMEEVASRLSAQGWKPY